MVDKILGSKNDGTGFTRAYEFSSGQRMNLADTLVYTAGDVVKEAHFWKAGASAGATSISLSIYDISNGHVGSSPIYTKVLSADSGTGDELYVSETAINDALSGLSGGETLAFQCTWGGGDNGWPGRRVASTNTSIGPSGTTPNNPWSEDSTSSIEGPDGYFVLGEAGPQLAITDPIAPGVTTTFSAINFGDPLTGVRITDTEGNVKELTLETQTSLSAPAVGNLDYALYGDVTVEVYNATESATATVAFNPPAGFDQIALEAGFATDQESFLYQYGGTPAAPDQMAYDPIASDTGETLTLQTNGYWTATGYGTWTVHSIDATDGYMEPFQFIWKSGSTPGNIISMRARRLKARANTAKPLRAR